MKWTVLCAGLLLLIPSALALDPDPLVTNGNRLAVALNKLTALERNSAPRSRVKPLLRTLFEEDSKNASRYFALSLRKCASGQTTSAKAALAHIGVDALRLQRAQAADLLERSNAGESVTLGGAPVSPPDLWPILAWIRREISEIQGSLDAQN